MRREAGQSCLENVGRLAVSRVLVYRPSGKVQGIVQGKCVHGCVGFQLASLRILDAFQD